MQTDDFKKWLEQKYPEENKTVNSRISNCKKVEKYYGNLDEKYDVDKCRKVISALNYTKDDERQNMPHLVRINGNIYDGLATLKQAVKLYVEFRNY